MKALCPALVSILVFPSLARAEDDADVEPTVGRTALESSDLRGKAGDWMIMPAGMYTLSGGINFITAPESPFEPDSQLRFTDMVLTSMSGRYSIKGRAEVGASIDLLPKQPAGRDDWVWQRAQLSGRVGFAKRYAGFVGLSGGPMFGGDGLWTSGAGGVEAQKSIHETLVFHGTAGAAVTTLHPESSMSERAWFGEVVAGGEMIFRAPNGMFAGWIGTSFHFPVAANDSRVDLELDPQTRANFSLGTVLSYIDDWDIAFGFEVIDRGDVADPATTLPILTGGFDQVQLVLGVTRRFKEKRSYGPMMLVGR